MFTHLCTSPHKTESPLVTLIRRIFILVFITSILTCFLILVVDIRSDLPSLKSTQEYKNYIPAPNIYFGFARGFIIGCAHINGTIRTSCNNAMIQPTFNASIQAYNGSYVSDVQMNKDLVLRFDLYSTENSSGLSLPVYMSIMDPGYGPNIAQYHSSIFPYNEPFVQLIEVKNIHFLSQNSNYIVRFTRKIRNILAPNDFGSYIGINRRNYPIPYVESNIEYLLYRNNTNGINWIAAMSITPASTFVENETEQRNRTVISLLGSISGIYAAIAAFYIFLFGPGIFSPWGYVQKSLISKEVLTFTADTPADTLEGLEKLSIEERVRRLEALDLFLYDHVIGVPFDRDSKAHKLDLKHGKNVKSGKCDKKEILG
ncbi:7424_t:CDS:10 [Gigaspora margarita]|uniref:7424_t:CDS:1 n=1 Tax=Gigaspora margarita TaxID=4874 RepID=A0ABN7UV19_GIGMA|nr:7424_t:CDS:10 [Gigaspora margarita]